MGRMKELYIEICEANGGVFPEEGISIEQAAEMRRLNLLNLEEYERHLTLQKLKDFKEENTDEENERDKD